MISANDSTILAMLSRYPDMPAEEANEYISKIEHEENVPICRAVLGMIGKEDLEEDARNTFEEFQRWSQDRTRRTRNEQWNARKRRQETRTALTLTKLHERGVITDQTLLMYGISGELPERHMYMAMSPEEKERLWSERMESRFGPNWLSRFDQNGDTPLPIFRGRTWGRHTERTEVNWRLEGF